MLLLPLPAPAQTDQEKELFSYINSDRAREHLPPFKWNSDLYKAATEHSRDMAALGQISHTGSDGSQPQDRIHATGVYASKTAENIARDINIISAHTSLMESLYHRENILDPEMTDAAVAVERSGPHLYVTEVFVRALDELTLHDARLLLLKQMNAIRSEHSLDPLLLSSSLSGIAQSHIEVQESLNALSPPLLMNLLSRQQKGAVRVNVFTVSTLTIPDEVRENLELAIQQVGIGYKRIRGPLCESGCYLVTLIFGPPVPGEPKS